MTESPHWLSNANRIEHNISEKSIPVFQHGIYHSAEVFTKKLFHFKLPQYQSSSIEDICYVKSIDVWPLRLDQKTWSNEELFLNRIKKIFFNHPKDVATAFKTA